jgi:hypothetical protein
MCGADTKMLGRLISLCGLSFVLGGTTAVFGCTMESGSLPSTTTSSAIAGSGSKDGGADASGGGSAAADKQQQEEDDAKAALECAAADESRMDRRALVCHRWRCDGRAGKAAATWDGGNAASCAAGELDADAGERALRVLNLHRFMAGLQPVLSESAWSSAAQQCALVAHANAKLSHNPTRDWKCWSDLAARTSAVSLIANRSAPIAIGAFMEDPGNEATMVHRRWLLSEELSEVSIGTTDRYACVIVDGETLGIAKKNTAGAATAALAAATKRGWTAWPPAGPIPIDVLTNERVDEIGWTLHASSDVLDKATVTVTSSKGKNLSIRLTHLTPLLGSRSAVRFVPNGWKTEAGETYTVKARANGSTAIELQVQPVDCQ